jgi:hypothetical protein
LPNSQSEPDQSSWVSLSQSGSYGWLDPRLAAKGDNHHGSETREWFIQIRTINGDTVRIAGTLTYQSISQTQ